jgi:hypothetical protein
LQRGKIEGSGSDRFIEACRERFGDAATRELAVATIRKLAAENGARWRDAYGDSIASQRNVAETVWAGGGSVDLEMLTEDKRRGLHGGAADSGYTSRQADANDG